MDCSQQKIADSLVKSYHELGGINRIDSANLPSKRTIIDVCERLLQLLFPGYHDEEPIPAEELEMITGERIATLVESLEVEVAKTLRLRDDESGETHSGLAQQARELVCEFLGHLPELRRGGGSGVVKRLRFTGEQPRRWAVTHCGRRARDAEAESAVSA